MINTHGFAIKTAEKFKYIEKFKQYKQEFKIHGIKSITDIESNLANDSQITLNTFFALCIYEKLNVIICDGKKFYETHLSDKNAYIITKNSKRFSNGTSRSKYTLDLTHGTEQSRERGCKIINENYSLGIGGKSSELKSITYYKLADLIIIATKLGLDIGEKERKNTIYGKIITELS